MPEVIATDTAVVAEVPQQTIGIGPNRTPRPLQRQQDNVLDPSLPAQTTFQEDLTTAGQRQINLIWEYTQAIIAIVVVVTTMISVIYAQIYIEAQVPNLVGVAFGMITGFYFSRTNHAAIGGIGPKPQERYTGR